VVVGAGSFFANVAHPALNLRQQFTPTLYEHPPYVGTACGETVCDIAAVPSMWPPLALSHGKRPSQKSPVLGGLDDGAVFGRGATEAYHDPSYLDIDRHYRLIDRQPREWSNRFGGRFKSSSAEVSYMQPKHSATFLDAEGAAVFHARRCFTC
jgi:hypothetical protein